MGSVRHLLPILVLGTACYPSAAFVGSTVKSLDCRTGRFTAELKVERQSLRKVKLAYEFLPGEFNVRDAQRTPERAVLEGKEGKTAIVQLQGALIDTCASGGLNVLGSYAPSGTTGFAEIDAVLPVQAPENVGADAADGSFSYPLLVTCCGAEGSGLYTVATLEGTGVTQTVAEPSEFECKDVEAHTVTVRGRLTGANPGRVRLSITDTSTGAVCDYGEDVARGPEPSPSPPS